MPQGEIIKCEICPNTFIRYKGNHKYCSRKCFLKAYKAEKSKNPQGIPLFHCWNCKTTYRMSFAPYLKKNFLLWKYYSCEKCGARKDQDPDLFGKFGPLD